MCLMLSHSSLMIPAPFRSTYVCSLQNEEMNILNHAPIAHENFFSQKEIWRYSGIGFDCTHDKFFYYKENITRKIVHLKFHQKANS